MRFYSERLHQHPAAPLPDKTDIPDGKEKTRRHAENFFLNQYRKLKEALAKQKEFSHFNEYDFNDILYYRFLLEQEKALFDSLTERRASDGNLLESIESLDRFYLLTKLDMISRLSHLEKLALPFPPNSIEYQRFNDNREATLLFLNALESKNHLASPDIRLYAALLHFLTLNTATESDQAADMFSTLLKDYGASVTVSRVNDFKVMLRAHWARRYRQTRDIRFVERIFRLQMDQLQQIAPTETIPASHLHNIILTSLKLQETNTAEQLLSAYEYRISGTNHPDLCRALWWTLVRIAQKKHAEAARILPHYYVYGDFDDIQMYAVAMMANVKICYELDTLEDELGNNMVRATTKRIREDKTFKPTDKEAQLHFVKLTKAAFRLKQKKRLSKNSPGAELNKLREEIARVNTIDKEWLLEKCGEVVSGK
jgi:ribosomal protein L29